MDMYKMIETYGKGRGEGKMWESVAVISDAVEHDMDAEARKRLMRKVYCVMSGGHYNEDFAKEDVAKMRYKDMNGKEHRAPYYTEEEVASVYEKVKGNISSYNMWDFYVVMNMVVSDYANILALWYPESSEANREKRYIELALNWLNDDDNPFGKEKIWKYMNG